MNNTTTISTPYRLTTEQWIQYTIFYIALGVVGFAGNCLIFGMIVKDKKLHAFFYVLLCGHCFGRAIYSLQCVNLGIYRIVANYTWNTFRINRLQCHTIHFMTYFCASFSSLTLLLLAVDRAYSLGRPTSYKKRSVKQGIIVIIVSILGTIATKIIPSYAGSTSFLTVIICNTAQTAVTTDWWNYNYYANFLLVLVSVIIYVALFIVAFIRKRSLSHDMTAHDEMAIHIIKRQLVLLYSIRLLIIVNVLTVLPFNILQLLSGYLEPSVRTQLVNYGASFSAIDRVLDPFILIWQSSDLLKSFKNLIKKHNNMVTLFTSKVSTNIA